MPGILAVHRYSLIPSGGAGQTWRARGRILLACLPCFSAERRPYLPRAIDVLPARKWIGQDPG